jgi:predicted ATPase
MGVRASDQRWADLVEISSSDPDRHAHQAGSETFAQQVRDALAHLYDLPYLQPHPLIAQVYPEGRGSTSGAAKRLQQRLIEAVEALRPSAPAAAALGGGADTRRQGRALRRYQVMALRYIEALPVDTIQQQLAISRTEYHRTHQVGLDLIVALLRERWAGTVPAPSADETAAARDPGQPPPAASAERSTPAPSRHVQHAARQMPLPLTRFIGREREFTAVRARLTGTAETDQFPSRLVTLTGSPGTGKTRLALQIATDLIDHFDDGVWLVELAPLADSALLPQTVASALGVREEPGQSLVDALICALQSKRLLLMLDNCEHLIEAAARLVGALLHACPGVQILATSREALAITGEVNFLVPSLGVPPPDRLLPVEELMLFESVQLFADRAEAALPDFAVTTQNVPAIAQICHQLDGIPLALELAAARVKGLGIEQLASRLNRRFRLLTSGSRTALPHQQTLQALVDWSYDLLGGQERTLFDRLSIFAGSFTLEAAETVCADDEGQKTNGDSPLARLVGLSPLVLQHDVLDLLLRLVDKSLVIAEPWGDGTDRYRLLKTLRQYGHERLVAGGEAATLQARHAAHYLMLAEAAAPHIVPGSMANRTWMDRLELERDNLWAAFRWYLEEARGGTREAYEQAERLVRGLAWFWCLRGYRSEARDAIASLLELPAAAPPSAARAEMLWALGTFATYQSDYAIARPLLEEALAIGRAVGDTSRIATALDGLGAIARFVGDYRGARSLLTESAALGLEIRQSIWVASAHGSLAVADYEQGDYAHARTLWHQTLAVPSGRAVETHFARASTHLGRLDLMQGNYAGARANCELGLAVARENSHRWAIAYALLTLGTLARLEGRSGDSRAHLEEALSLLRDLGNRRDQSLTLIQLALLAAAGGDIATARSAGDEGLAIARRIGARFAIDRALLGAAIVARLQGEVTHSRAYLEECLAIAREIGDRHHTAAVLANLGVLDHDQGDLASARARYAESLALRRQMGERGGMAALLESFAGLDASEGRLSRALRLFSAAAAVRTTMGNRPPPEWHDRVNRWLAPARQTLPASMQQTAWDTGQAISLEQAIAEALQTPGAGQ